MLDISDLVEVFDRRTDEQLQTEAASLSDLLSRPVAWQDLRHDFSSYDWKPMLHIEDGTQHPYHAYIGNIATAEIDLEGMYPERTEAESRAMEYASMINSNAVE